MKGFTEIKSRYEFQLDNRQVVLIVSGLLLVLMLSFLMGTLFGLNLTRMGGDAKPLAAAPVEPATPVVAAPANPAEMAGLVSADSIFSEKAAETAAPTPAPSPVIVAASTAREALIQSLESQKPQIPAATTPAPTPAAPPVLAKIEEKKVTEPVLAKPVTVKPTEKPAVESTALAKPAAAPSPVIPAGAYTIQLTSTSERADAQKIVSDLQGKKFDAYLLQVSLPDRGIFYRVRVGHYRDADQAKKALQILQARESNYFDAWITQ